LTAQAEPLRVPNRRFFTLAAPILAAVAIVGYLIGHAHTPSASPVKTRTLSTSRFLLDYPADWRRVAGGPEIPGLPITHAVVLAPGGQASHAGLVAGQLAGGEAGPLPRSFVASLPRLPLTAVVDLLEVQAYRYAQLAVPGFSQSLTLYAIPNPAGNETVLACYAGAAFSDQLRTCDQIVATVTLAGQAQSYDLTPEAAYARELSSSIAGLNGQRLDLRRMMGSGASPAAVAALASRLARKFADTAAGVSTLEPSLVARRAQAALSKAMVTARRAYTALAAAAGSPPRSQQARRQVYEAEADVNAALADFSLLGYAQG
jgi:hypothetical protein